METVISYRCEICGNRFSTAEQAKECESSHVSIKGSKVRERYSFGSAEPKYIEVLFPGRKDRVLYEKRNYNFFLSDKNG